VGGARVPAGGRVRRFAEFDAKGMPTRGGGPDGESAPPAVTRMLGRMFKPPAPELLSRIVSEKTVAELAPGGFLLIEHRRDGSWRLTTDVEGDTAAVAFADHVEDEPERGVPSMIEMTVLLDGEPLGKWTGKAALDGE
jgi:hypothetical protein